MVVLIFVALIAGLATAVSPCVLPILPIVLATGADGDRRRPFLVIAGLIASFSFFTLASVQIIRALHLPSSSLRDAAIVIIAVFGLTLLVPALNVRFERLTARLPVLGARLASAGRPGAAGIDASGLGNGQEGPSGSGPDRSGAAGVVTGLATGVGLGLVWTPCAGPILGAITSLAVTAPGSWATLTLVVAYAIGAGVPLLAIALGGRSVLLRLRLRSASAWAGRAFGILVLATAGLMAVGADTAISADLTGALPDWTGTLQTLERTGQVQSALHDIGAGSNASTVPGAVVEGVSGLPAGPAAPELTGIDHWLNSDPLTLAGLHGKVVLIDFWTYSCINCIRTLPYVEGWYQKYADEGFVVVGVHTPEFAFEHDSGNVSSALSRFGITYPVAQDNEYGTWNAYGNEYWPADYLIDATGHIRSEHFGEGDYDKTEAEIRGLLADAGKSALPTPAEAVAAAPPFVSNETPETYIGTARADTFASPESAAPGSNHYSFPGQLPDDQFAVSGTFDFQQEYATASASGDKLELSFYARDVYLVAAADSPVPATVTVTGVTGNVATDDVAADGSMSVGGARLYHLVHLPAAARGTVTITFNAAGARCYSFTFGG